jgi:hypothetical protein
MIGFIATIVPHLSWGLNWKVVEEANSYCENNGWLNVLYVNNFFNQTHMVKRIFILIDI